MSIQHPQFHSPSAMDDIQNMGEKAITEQHSKVDTSRPFNSVREAVAIFGERLLTGDLYIPKAHTASPKREDTSSTRSFTSSPGKPSEGDDVVMSNYVKKLEAELEEAKIQLKLLKERESESEVALAALNAELHRNMSKLARAEAAEAARAVATKLPMGFQRMAGQEDNIRTEQERLRDLMIGKMEDSRTLADILSLGEQKGYYEDPKEKKMRKKKPVVPLVGDLFSWKKKSSTTLHNPLFQLNN